MGLPLHLFLTVVMWCQIFDRKYTAPSTAQEAGAELCQGAAGRGAGSGLARYHYGGQEHM